MHQLQELVRLHRLGVGCRVIARQLRMSPNTERLYRQILTETGWLEGPADELPSLEALQEVVLLHRPKRPLAQHSSKLEGYRDAIATMMRTGAKPKAIFDRLRLEHADFEGSLSAVKRLCSRLAREEGMSAEQVAVPVQTGPGEVAQVDFGSVGHLYDPSRGVFRKAYVFVMTLGYSRHSYYGLSWDQTASSWLRLHQEAFRYFGGIPRVVVPDNLKSAVVRAAFTPNEPSELCLSYREFAQYHGFQVDPTPPYAPQKKGKVEADVKYVKQNFFAPRSEQKDYPVLAQELARWSREVAAKRVHGTTHQQPLALFEQEEKSALLPLPKKAYETVLWKVAKVHRDCCVQYEGARYSVPWRLVGQEVLIRATPTSLAVLFENVRVATHEKAARGQAVLEDAHLPEVRSDYRHRTRAYWEKRAACLGPEVAQYIREVFEHDDVLSQLRPVQAMVTHLEGFPRERREAACKRARLYGNHSYRSLKSILQKALDRQPLPTFLEPALQDLSLEEQAAPEEPNAYRFARAIEELVH